MHNKQSRTNKGSHMVFWAVCGWHWTWTDGDYGLWGEDRPSSYLKDSCPEDWQRLFNCT